MDEIWPWTKVRESDNAHDRYTEQCATGAIDEDSRLRARKGTLLTANHLLLLEPFDDYKCDGTHEHIHPRGKALERLRVYPWKFCEIVVKGIRNLKHTSNKERMCHGYVNYASSQVSLGNVNPCFSYRGNWYQSGTTTDGR